MVRLLVAICTRAFAFSPSRSSTRALLHLRVARMTEGLIELPLGTRATPGKDSYFASISLSFSATPLWHKIYSSKPYSTYSSSSSSMRLNGEESQVKVWGLDRGTFASDAKTPNVFGFPSLRRAQNLRRRSKMFWAAQTYRRRKRKRERATIQSKRWMRPGANKYRAKSSGKLIPSLESPIRLAISPYSLSFSLSLSLSLSLSQSLEILDPHELFLLRIQRSIFFSFYFFFSH